MIQQNFIELYEKSFTENWELPALSDYNGISYTYGEVAKQVARLHLMYETMGIKKGDKIAVFGKNSANWCISFMSVFTYGAVVVPILSDFKPDDAHTIINHSDSVMLISGQADYGDPFRSEMKAVKAIISMEDFDILSSKPTATFKKALRGTG